MISVTMGIRENVTAIRKSLGWNRNQLAKRSGLTATQVKEIEEGKNREPGPTVLAKLANGLGVSPSGLLEEPVIPPGIDHDAGRPLITQELPMKGISSGGDWLESEDLDETYPVLRHRDEKRPKGEQFVVRLQGDSMFPTVHSGDLVLFEATDKVADGQIAVVQKAEVGTTIKRVYRQKGGSLLLKGDNPSFKPMETRPGEAKVIARFLRIVEGKR